MDQVFLLRDDLHGPSAENKARSYQHRITDIFGRRHARFDRRHRLSLRLRNLQRNQQFFKGISVLRPFNGVKVRTDDIDAPAPQRLCQIDGRLTTKSRNNALRLFQFDNIDDILGTQRFKIQLV